MRIVLDVKDKAYDNVMYILKNLSDIKIIDEEFKIDEDFCIETLNKIQKGNLKDFKTVKPDELFNELGI